MLLLLISSKKNKSAKKRRLCQLDSLIVVNRISWPKVKIYLKIVMFTLKVTLTLVAFAIFITFLVVCCYFTNLLDKLLGWAIVEVDDENGLRRGFNFVFFYHGTSF